MFWESFFLCFFDMFRGLFLAMFWWLLMFFWMQKKDARRLYDHFGGGIAPRSLLCVRKRKFLFWPKHLDFQTPPPPTDEPSDPNLTPLPTHPGIKYVARSLAATKHRTKMQAIISQNIGAWRAKREIVSFRVVRACARCLCEVRSGWKSLGRLFPFSLFRWEVFPFPSALQGPIQLQLALSVHFFDFLESVNFHIWFLLEGKVQALLLGGS